MTIRIDKLLSNLGYESRKGAGILVKQGRFQAGDMVIKNPAAKIDPTKQDCFIDGIALDPIGPLTIAMHKPVGVLCDNAEYDDNIFAHLPYRWQCRNPGFSCAGRLDKDSHGLVILSEDGALVHQLISPKSNVAKTYIVHVQNPMTKADIVQFQSGDLMLKGEDKPLLPVAVKDITDGPNGPDTVITLELHEGRNRQIRRMFGSRNNKVTDLQRIQIGKLSLDSLNLNDHQFSQITKDDLF